MTRTWPLHATAVTLVAAGLLVPHALLVAAGLLLAGSAALRPPSEP
ncbi:hypothetical protein ACFOWZ_16040 [Lentzea rhizosphaerae]|uniref:Uncharacterized protein n=1 Tax=Lentzea rhizosphaerae TaxID=2041025 RepID=A0ABV8BTE8_9PSEU